MVAIAYVDGMIQREAFEIDTAEVRDSKAAWPRGISENDILAIITSICTY